MPTRPKFFLLDAGPVIELHRLGVWERIVETCDLLVPRHIALEEARFWVHEDGSIHAIHLQRDIEAGRIRAPEAEPETVIEILNIFDPVMREGVDAGELAALAILMDWPGEERPVFCTGDRLATVALCLLGFSELAVSLEELLDNLGLSREPRRQFRRGKMDAWVKEGTERRLRGEGLKKGEDDD